MATVPVRTSGPDHSIWKHLNEDTFRKHILKLSSVSSHVPVDPQVHTNEAWEKRSGRATSEDGLLPLSVEKQVADNFAFLAAATEGAHSVSAAAVETYEDPRGVIIRLAANSGVVSPVKEALTNVLDSLQQCASGRLSVRQCRTAIFDIVVKLHMARIHGRLRSKYWQRPGYYIGNENVSLHEDLRKWARENLHAVSTSERYRTLLDALEALCDIYKIVDTSADKTTADIQLGRVIRESYDLCTSGGKCSLEKTVKRAGMDPNTVCDNANIRQVNSIGYYWHACSALSKFARRYNMFTKIALECLQPYQSIDSTVHEVRKPTTCHVHAEIQVLTFYELKAATNKCNPRVIGSSKAVCYLCDLFIKHHGRFLITSTHGRIHTQWTVPDLENFTEDSIERFRRTLRLMDWEIARLSVDKEITKWRRYPKESRLDVRLDPSATSISTARATSLPKVNVEPRAISENEEIIGPDPLAGPKHIEPVVYAENSTTVTSPFTQEKYRTSGEHSLASANGNEQTSPGLPVIKCASAREKHLSPHKSRSFRSRDRCVEVYVEIEEPGTGMARFAEISVDETIEALDVLDFRTMEPGSSKQYDLQEGSQEITINLLLRTDELACLRLRWT